MAIESSPDQLEPADLDAVIWRFMDMRKFRDLITTGELYLRRADRFEKNDDREGLPPEEYLATLGLNPFNINERQQLMHQIGSDAQRREGFYISCWPLFREETSKMWKEYGDPRKNGPTQYLPNGFPSLERRTDGTISASIRLRERLGVTRCYRICVPHFAYSRRDLPFPCWLC